MHTDTSDIDKAHQATYSGYAAAKAVWSQHRTALLAARDALAAVKGANLNPAGTMELHRLLEAIGRNEALFG